MTHIHDCGNFNRAYVRIMKCIRTGTAPIMQITFNLNNADKSFPGHAYFDMHINYCPFCQADLHNESSSWVDLRPKPEDYEEV